VTTPNPYLVPQIEDIAQPFWDGCLAGELRVQRCVDTQRLLFPPRPRSPWGERRVPEWVAVSGRGTVWSFVVPHPPLLEPFATAAPYNVIVVALDEDPTVRLVGNLVDDHGSLTGIDPESIVIGEPVRVVFDPVTDEIAMPRWTRV
jgi:uncharacterized OB-fold protein